MFVSQVKEKEKARKEYKQAIEKGHGAYLMDQDAPVRLSTHTHTHGHHAGPELFSVSWCYVGPFSRHWL